ncbi:MAG: PDZ domain-containing protein [Patescibacteria group bacterium]
MSNQFKTSKRFWSIVLISVLCGLSAGVLGEIITRVYILKDFSIPYFNNEINVADLAESNSGLVIRDAKKVVVNQDVKVVETLAGLRPVLMGVFPEGKAGAAGTDYYDLNDPLFIGLVITADGWVMAVPTTEAKKNFLAADYVAIGGDRRLYEIDEIAEAPELPGDLLIFHLAGATNLPVRKIAARSELALGDTLLAIKDLSSVQPTALTAFSSPVISSSDSLSVRLDLAGPESDLKGSLVFNLAGDLAALVTADQEVIPAFSYAPFWQVFKEDAPSRPILGVNYLDLSRVKTASLNIDKGAWLYSGPDAPAVLKGSPAEAAGLKAGDVIIWVNNQEINVANDLVDILTAYRPGDKIILTYLRAGEEKTAEVKLSAPAK